MKMQYLPFVLNLGKARSPWGIHEIFIVSKSIISSTKIALSPRETRLKSKRLLTISPTWSNVRDRFNRVFHFPGFALISSYFKSNSAESVGRILKGLDTWVKRVCSIYYCVLRIALSLHFTVKM